MTQQDDLAALSADERKAKLTGLVSAHWPRSPWSNMPPQVIDTAKADVGVGLALYYPVPRDDVQVLMLKAKGQEKYQIPGGFMNLAADGDATPQAAGAREAGEELVYADGTPVLSPAKIARRLQGKMPLDFNKISVRGAPRIVTSFDCRLHKREYEKVTKYSEALMGSAALSSQLAAATHGEIDGVAFIPLSTLRENHRLLRHPDQATLFEKLAKKLRQPALV